MALLISRSSLTAYWRDATLAGMHGRNMAFKVQRLAATWRSGAFVDSITFTVASNPDVVLRTKKVGYSLDVELNKPNQAISRKAGF